MIIPPPRPDGRPGEYFTWSEMQTTSTGLPNAAPFSLRRNLRHLCQFILDPLREELGPIKVNSGYRSPTVNAAVGGSKTSAHMKGLAADIVSYRGDYTTADIVKAVIRLRLEVDQVIMYESGFVHIGLSETPRRQFLYKPRNGGYEPMGLDRL